MVINYMLYYMRREWGIQENNSVIFMNKMV